MKQYRKPEGTVVHLCCEDILTESTMSLGGGDYGVAMPGDWANMVRDLNEN